MRSPLKQTHGSVFAPGVRERVPACCVHGSRCCFCRAKCSFTFNFRVFPFPSTQAVFPLLYFEVSCRSLRGRGVLASFHPDQENASPLKRNHATLQAQGSLIDDYQEKLSNAEKIELMKQEFQKKEAEWELSREDLKRDAEEKLASMFLELRGKAESEKLSIINRFELREASMRHLQDQQAAQILDLERSLREQQGHLRQLEQELTRDEVLLCSQCGKEPPVAQDEKNAILLREKEDCALQLLMAQNRWVKLWDGGFGVEPPVQSAGRG